MVIETMLEEKLGYRETARRFQVCNHPINQSQIEKDGQAASLSVFICYEECNKAQNDPFSPTQ